MRDREREKAHFGGRYGILRRNRQLWMPARNTVRRILLRGQMKKKFTAIAAICMITALLAGCSSLLSCAGKQASVSQSGEEDPTLLEQTADLLGLPVARTEGLSGFLYDQLPEAVQEVYGQLYTGIADHKTEFTIRAENADLIRQALNAVINDHPEYFWLTGSASMSGFKGIGIWKISLECNLPEEEIGIVSEQIRQAAQEYLAALPEGASEYDKVKTAYEYIVFHTDYSRDSEQDQNIQSVFVHHRSVCAGYARAFKYLLDQAGVWCGVVEGYITDTGEGHAWNVVRIDGICTYVDPSWGDPTYGEDVTDAGRLDIIYDFLCLTGEEMQKLRHEAETGILLPDCTDRSFDYYMLHGLYYSSWDAETVSAALWNAVNAGDTTVLLKFGTAEAYAQALTALFPDTGDSLLKDPLQQKMEWDLTDSMPYYYSCSDELLIIKIYW